MRILIIVAFSLSCTSESVQSRPASGDAAGPAADAPAVPTDTATPIPSDELTWHSRTRALVQSACVGCHTEGGVAPFSLATLDDVVKMGPAVKAAVESGRMPPWTPDPTCRPMEGERLLADDDRAALLAWLDEPVEGDPAAYVAPEAPAEPPPHALEVMPALPYTASRAVPDDYRCLPLAYTFDRDTFVTGFDVFPSHRPIVHHVLLYVAGPADLELLQSLDDEDEGPGYTCYGGPRVGDGATLGGWVPGSVGFHLPPGVAMLVPKGSKVIMQIHYNTLGLPPGEVAPAEQTAVRFWTLGEDENPKYLARIVPFANGGIYIPAGEAESVQTLEETVPIPGTLIGTVPHMHTLGTRISASLEREGEPSQCVVNVPEWDFSWQQFYLYPPEHYIDVRPGDVLKLTCVYDNSAANQAVVNGVQVEPRDVRWGEGTLDEMCLNYLILRMPYLPPDGSTVCPGFVPCATACGEGDLQCFLDCSLYAGFECAGCVLPELGTCAAGNGCGEGLSRLVACLDTCQSDRFACLLGDCREDMSTVYDCVRPKLLEGACDADLESCEVDFSK